MPDVFGRRTVYRSTRMTCDFEMDRGGMRKMARGTELRASVRLVAQKAKGYAESIAPKRSGDYARRFEIHFTRITIRGLRRVAARVVNLDPQARIIEWGSEKRNTPAHLTLTRTLQWLGGETSQVGFLGAPSVRTGAGQRLPVGGREAQPIPTMEAFRAEQQRRRDQDRRYRQRRRRRRAGGG